MTLYATTVSEIDVPRKENSDSFHSWYLPPEHISKCGISNFDRDGQHGEVSVQRTPGQGQEIYRLGQRQQRAEDFGRERTGLMIAKMGGER